MTSPGELDALKRAEKIRTMGRGFLVVMSVAFAVAGGFFISGDTPQ